MNRPPEERDAFKKTLQSEDFRSKLQEINSKIDVARLCDIFLMKDANEDFFQAPYQRNGRSYPGYHVSNSNLYAAVMQCATYGVEPIHQRVYLIPKSDQIEVKLSYLGLLYIVYKDSGIILEAQNVFQDDEFSVDYGSKDIFVHKPNVLGVQNWNTLLGTYCWYVTKDGVKRFVWAPKSEIANIRNASKSKDGVWSSFCLEMCKKAAIRRALKSVLQLIDVLPDNADIELSKVIEEDDKASFDDDVSNENDSAETPQSASGRLASKFNK